MERSGFWSISWLRHQMFYPYVTITAAQARENGNLRHAMSPFSLFLSSFLGAQRILGYVRSWRIVAVHPPKRGKDEGRICGLHLEEPSNWDSLWTALWHNWPSNAASEGCRPWIETQQMTYYLIMNYVCVYMQFKSCLMICQVSYTVMEEFALKRNKYSLSKEYNSCRDF